MNDYIFRRPHSQNWYVRLREDNGRRYVQSLGTSDKLQAQALAAVKIGAHKARLAAARPRYDVSTTYKLEPGRKHPGPDGGEIIADEKELIYLDHGGTIIRREPNVETALQLVFRDPLTVHGLAVAAINAPLNPRKAKSGDDMILETYLARGGRRKAGVHGFFRREAESVWAMFKSLTGGKALRECTPDDGHLLVEHYRAEGLKNATIAKKLTWLRSAVNLAIREGRFKTINPFSGIAPDPDDDKAKRLRLDEPDVTLCMHSLTRLSAPDQLLLRMLGATGMRLSEAFQIDGEEPRNNGPRFVIVGQKTSQSQRRVPLPADVLPYVPAIIKGQLFGGTPAAASKRLNRFLRDIGITDGRKVVHSLRHRAQDRLRDADCPTEIRWALLGHEDDTVAAGYGEGFSTAKLKSWIDRIGFR